MITTRRLAGAWFQVGGGGDEREAHGGLGDHVQGGRHPQHAAHAVPRPGATRAQPPRRGRQVDRVAE